MAFTYLELEDQALALLEPLRSGLNLRTLAPYAGECAPEAIEQMLIPCPAIYVYLADLVSNAQGAVDNRELVLTLFGACTNLRGEVEAKRGDGETVGVYSLLEAARNKINRAALGNGAAFLKRERVVYYSAASGLCIAQADYGLTDQTTWQRRRQ